MSAFSIGLGLGGCIAVAAGDIPTVPQAPLPVLLPPAEGPVEIVVRNGAVTVTLGAPGVHAGTYATTTAALAAGPVWLAPPALSGGTGLGAVLTGRPGLVLHPAGRAPTVARQWLRDGAPIAGATGATRTIAAADQGRTLSLRETATNADGARSVASAPLAIPAAPVAPPPPPPANTAAPAITGTAQVGRTLTLSTGTWSGAAPITYAYRWLRGPAVIADATGATYAPVAEDVGAALTGEVRATNGAGTSAWVASAPTAPVAAAPVVTPPAPELLLPGDGTVEIGINGATATLTIADTGLYDGTYTVTVADLAAGPAYLLPPPAPTGPAEAGGVLAAVPGLVLHPAGRAPAIARQWLRDGAAIPGATGETYALSAADQGCAIALRETATNADGARSATSPARAVPAAAVAIAYAMSGAPTQAGFRVAVGTVEAAAGLTLEWSTDPTLASGVTRTAAVDVDAATKLARFDVAGAPAGARVYYRARHRGQPTGAIRSARTLPASGAFTMAFASCGEPGAAPTWGQIAARDPHFFLALGDTPYIDYGGTDPAAFRTAFRGFYASSWVQALLSTTPWVYTWDDHDYSANNGGASSPTRDAARAVYREMQPHYPLAGAGAIHHAFTVGQTRFIVLDVRSERGAGDVLGAAQLAWLKGELDAAAASAAIRLVAIANSVPWISGADGDTWFGAAAQRAEINDHIFARGLERRTIMLSGDAHMLAYDDGTNNTANTGGRKGFPVAHSAPLNRANGTKGGPYTTPPITASRHQYSTMTVAPRGDGELDVTITGYANDVAAYAATFATAAPAPAAVAPASTTAPTTSGGTRVGETRTMTDGAWSGTAPIAYERRWLRGAAAIAGATGAAYVLAAADEGATVTGEMRATNAAGASAWVPAGTSAVVTAAAPAFGTISQSAFFNPSPRGTAPTFTSIAMAYPSTPAAGSLLVAAVAADKSGGEIAMPAGWNLVDGDSAPNEVRGGVWWRVADGGPLGTITATQASATKMSGQLLEIAGPVNASALLGSASDKRKAQARSVTLALASEVSRVPAIALAWYMNDSQNAVGGGAVAATGGFVAENLAPNPLGDQAAPGMIVARKLIASPETPSTTISHSGANDGSIGFLAVFGKA